MLQRAGIFIGGFAVGVIAASLLIMPAHDSIKVAGGALAGALLTGVILILLIDYIKEREK